MWMARHHPDIPFERYADDAILHGRTREAAERLREAIIARLAACGLELNLQKTKIVYCKETTEEGTTSTRSSPSWATSSGPGEPRTTGVNAL